VDYSGAGVFTTEAAPCVILGGSAKLRKDHSPAYHIQITVDSADQHVSDTIRYDVSGHTDVVAESTSTYTWTCVVELSADRKSLKASLTSFQADAGPGG